MAKEQNTDRVKTVTRSNAYPSYTIEYAIELTRKIYSQFGSSSHNTRETIAKVLNMSAGYITQPLSTATQYGLLDMKAKIGYNPTSLFLKLYKPENNEEKQEGLIECIKNPKLYENLLESYKGNIVPTINALATTLFRRHNISENASTKAAEIFLENLKYIDLLDSENKLQDIEKPLDSYNQDNEDLNVVQQQEIIKNENCRPSQVISSDLHMDIKLNDGRKAKIIYSDNINDDDWSKIVRVITALKDF